MRGSPLLRHVANVVVVSRPAQPPQETGFIIYHDRIQPETTIMSTATQCDDEGHDKAWVEERMDVRHSRDSYYLYLSLIHI